MIGEVSPTELLDVDVAKATVLDVRTPMEYGLGTVPGAINANFDYEEEEFDQAALEIVAKLDKEKPVYVFCHVGPRSEMAAEVLDEMGFQVFDVPGGYRAIQRAMIERMS